MNRNVLKKFFVLLGICSLVYSVSAEALAFHAIKIDNTRGYQNVLLEGVFGKRHKSKQETLAETVDDFKIVDQESFYRYAPEIHKIPFNDPALSFRIRIPDTWEEIPLRLEKTLKLTTVLMSNLFHYIGPPVAELRPSLRVQAMKLDREIRAEDWLRYFLLTNSYTILEDKIESISPQNAFSHFIYIKEDVTYVGFLKVIIHGDIVSLVRFDVPQAHVEKYKILQKASVESFKLVFPETGKIEGRKKQKLAGGSLYLEYPSSWKRKKQRHNDRGEKVSFELHNSADEKTVFGLMKFQAKDRVSETSFEVELKSIRKELKEKYGLYVKSVISSEPTYGPIRFDYIREEKYVVGFGKDKNIQDQELTLLVLADIEWYIFIYVISPLKEYDLLNWAINNRAYEIIKESFE